MKDPAHFILCLNQATASRSAFIGLNTQIKHCTRNFEIKPKHGGDLHFRALWRDVKLLVICVVQTSSHQPLSPSSDQFRLSTSPQSAPLLPVSHTQECQAASGRNKQQLQPIEWTTQQQKEHHNSRRNSKQKEKSQRTEGTTRRRNSRSQQKEQHKNKKQKHLFK